MTPEEYIEKLKEAQRTLDMVKEDLDRAIDRMQRRIETGYVSLNRQIAQTPKEGNLFPNTQ